MLYLKMVEIQGGSEYTAVLARLVSRSVKYVWKGKGEEEENLFVGKRTLI